MGFQSTLLSNVLVAVSIPVIANLVQSFSRIDPSLTALCVTLVWLTLQTPNGGKYALFVLLVPYSIGVFAAIYQKNLFFSFSLLSQVLIEGKNELASINSLNAFYKYYCP